MITRGVSLLSARFVIALVTTIVVVITVPLLIAPSTATR